MVHDIAIVTPTSSGIPDDYGHAIPGEPSVEVTVGNIQPRKAREIALSTNAGAELADYRIYTPFREVPASGAWIRDEPDRGRRFDIVGAYPREYGRSPHLAFDCRLVTSDDTEGEAGS
jgi:hypothetical protein